MGSKLEDKMNFPQSSLPYCFQLCLPPPNLFSTQQWKYSFKNVSHITSPLKIFLWPSNLPQNKIPCSWHQHHPISPSYFLHPHQLTSFPDSPSNYTAFWRFLEPCRHAPASRLPQTCNTSIASHPLSLIYFYSWNLSPWPRLSVHCPPPGSQGHIASTNTDFPVPRTMPAALSIEGVLSIKSQSDGEEELHPQLWHGRLYYPRETSLQ